MPATKNPALAQHVNAVRELLSNYEKNQRKLAVAVERVSELELVLDADLASLAAAVGKETAAELIGTERKVVNAALRSVKSLNGNSTNGNGKVQ